MFAHALAWPLILEWLAALQALTCLGHMDALGFWFGMLGNRHGALPCRVYTRERQRMNRAVPSISPLNLATIRAHREPLYRPIIRRIMVLPRLVSRARGPP